MFLRVFRSRIRYHTPFLWNKLLVWALGGRPLSTFKTEVTIFLFDKVCLLRVTWDPYSYTAVDLKRLETNSLDPTPLFTLLFSFSIYLFAVITKFIIVFCSFTGPSCSKATEAYDWRHYSVLWVCQYRMLCTRCAVLSLCWEACGTFLFTQSALGFRFWESLEFVLLLQQMAAVKRTALSTTDLQIICNILLQTLKSLSLL